MKKITIFLLLFTFHSSLFTRSALAQSVDPRVQKLCEELTERGFSVDYEESHDYSLRETKINVFMYNVLLNDDKTILEKVRSTMNEISHTAYKSYFYESHKNGKDTIDFAIMIQDSPENNIRDYNGFTQWYSPEILTFNQGRFGMTYPQLHYSKRVIENEPEKPFDIKGFSKIISPLLKGHKRYKILFTHDAEWSSKEDNQNMRRRMTSITGRDDYSGTIKGYVYHLKGKECKAILRQIQKATEDHISQHQEQGYRFSYSGSSDHLIHQVTSHSPFTLHGMSSSTDISQKSILIDTYSLPYEDEAFVLVADSYGCLWLPSYWHKLSKEVNGVQTPNKKLKDLK